MVKFGTDGFAAEGRPNFPTELGAQHWIAARNPKQVVQGRESLVAVGLEAPLGRRFFGRAQLKHGQHATCFGSLAQMT